MKNSKLPGMVLRVLWAAGCLLLACFGFLSGMFSEGLIGNPHPMANMLADVIVWFGVVVGLSPIVCLGVSSVLQVKPVARRIVLALPFILLAVQLVLCHAATML